MKAKKTKVRRKTLKSKARRKSVSRTWRGLTSTVTSTVASMMTPKMKKFFKDPRNVFGTASAALVAMVFAFHFGTSKGVSIQAPAFTGKMPAEFAKTMGMNMGDRVAHWTRALANTDGMRAKIMKYGTAPKIGDTAALVPSKFDCTTFVETVVALSRSKNPNEFYPNLLAVRYKNSEPTFLTRNHFPEADWLPNNMNAGILRDITAQVGRAAGVSYQTEGKEVHKAAWLNAQVKQGKVSRSIASSTDKSWSQTTYAEVRYIPVADVDKVLNSIPNGTVINMVRKNNPKWPVIITHQGFVVRVDGKVYLRHALEGGAMKVVPLSDYIHSLAKQRGTWPLIGINLNEVQG
ncbi:DUF1460 domain-containing protein [bacterium]|nr:DUF1460 domain-containing protein [bacterium]